LPVRRDGEDKKKLIACTQRPLLMEEVFSLGEKGEHKVRPYGDDDELRLGIEV
jgi:hypothetical protein